MGTHFSRRMEPQKCAAPTGATKNKRGAMLTCMWHSCTGPDSHEVEDMTLEKTLEKAWICDEEVLREGSNTAPQTLERKLKVEEPFKLFIRNIIFIRRKKKRINIWQLYAFFIYSLFFVYSHWKYLRINIGFWGSDGSFANKLTLAFFIRRVYSYYETALRVDFVCAAFVSLYVSLFLIQIL